MNEIQAYNVPQAYVEAIHKMRIWGKKETSRNGPVLTCPEPVLLTITNPRERVLFDPVRDANPFFHVMEFIWMIAGSKDIWWLEQFNKRMRKYADPGTDNIHGAYGFRWRFHFDLDQIGYVAGRLKKDCYSRQCVMAMWDARVDLVGNHNDIPCNTQIMFRYDSQRRGLDMTVINRSNDLIWGMLGANAVHMTYLHELVSRMAGITQGKYRVFTNNLHIYTQMPKFEQIWGTVVEDDKYGDDVEYYPLLQGDETYEDLSEDCVRLIENPDGFGAHTKWMKYVGRRMYELWFTRNISEVDSIQATDWRLACREWLERRQTSSVTSTVQSP